MRGGKREGSGRKAKVVDLGAMEKELEMLRLEVARLKGELAEARKHAWKPDVGGYSLPADAQAVRTEIQWSGKLGKNCAGRGVCGKLGCPHV